MSEVKAMKWRANANEAKKILKQIITEIAFINIVFFTVYGLQYTDDVFELFAEIALITSTYIMAKKSIIVNKWIPMIVKDVVGFAKKHGFFGG